jgi:hypothetical protein
MHVQIHAAASTGRRLARALVALPLVLATVAPPSPAPSPAPSMPWISVGAPRAADGRRPLVDEDGRERLFRGVNAGLEWWVGVHGRPFSVDDFVDGKCPPNENAVAQDGSTVVKRWKEPPLCGRDALGPLGKWRQPTDASSGNDLAQMRAMGINMLRLAINWAQLEPEPGRISEAYLDRIAQVVAWAKEQDVHTVIDMHQDNYGPWARANATWGAQFSNANMDGAPRWATVANFSAPVAGHRFPRWERSLLADFVPVDWHDLAAFEAFWDNARVPETGRGLQEHYIGALSAVASRFRDEPAVLGYEIMNEPNPGFSLTSIDPFTMASEQLYPFYRAAVQAVTGVRDGLPSCPPGRPFGDAGRASRASARQCAYPPPGDVRGPGKNGTSATDGASSNRTTDARHILFFEPMGFRDELDFSPQLIEAPFTSYAQLAFAPHTYSMEFTGQVQDDINRAVSALWPASALGPAPVVAYPPSFSFALDTAWWEAGKMNATVFVTEYGGGGGEPSAATVEAITREQERHSTSAALWPWKENAGWGVWAQAPQNSTAASGPVRPLKERLVSRAFPLAVAGELSEYAFDPLGLSFSLAARAESGWRGGDTLVYVPARVNATAVPSGRVRVGGAATLVRVEERPDGSRVVVARPSAEGGAYAVAWDGPEEAGEETRERAVEAAAAEGAAAEGAAAEGAAAEAAGSLRGSIADEAEALARRAERAAARMAARIERAAARLEARAERRRRTHAALADGVPAVRTALAAAMARARDAAAEASAADADEAERLHAAYGFLMALKDLAEGVGAADARSPGPPAGAEGALRVASA